MAALLLTACQDGAISPTNLTSLTQQVGPGSSVAINVSPRIVDMGQASDPDHVFIRFERGTSAAAAISLGRQYGLQLVDGPLIDGPWADGRFVFKTPNVTIEATTPTTARVYFPSSTSNNDRITFMQQNHLHFLRWLRPDEDTAIALVKLPPSDLRPELINTVAGLFRLALPAGLDLKAVVQWAAGAGLELVSYATQTGTTVVRALRWTPPVVVQPVVRRASLAPPPKPATNALLYVQFAQSLIAGDVGKLVQGLGLTLIDLSPSNFATLKADPARIRGDLQLLSDMATVQCVSTSVSQCGHPIGAMPVAGAPPAPQLLAQPAAIQASLEDGVLTLHWQRAAGATAYEVFVANSQAGPFAPVATVVGGSQSSYHVAAITAPGDSSYYLVLALHPCPDATIGIDCDVLTPSYPGAGGVRVAWTNPPTVAVPQPPAAPSSPDPAAASSEPAQAPTPAQAPQQTRAGPSPLSAPAGLSASAADGHVTISWQAVAGSGAYRLYRSTAGGPAAYVAQTSQTTFTDVGGDVGTTYSYRVAAIAPDGLLGSASSAAEVVWAAVTSAPTVLRALPAQAQALSGIVRFQVDVQSPSGSGSVEWKITGAAAAAAIGRADGHAIASSALSWSAAVTWDTGSLPDGTYTVTATVIDTGGPQVSSLTQYRIENGAAIAPTGLTALQQAGGVSLSWAQAATDGAASYELFRDQPVSSAPLAVFSTERRTFADENVDKGAHLYQLVLVDVAGHRSAPAVATVVVKPTSTAASAPALSIDLRLPTGQVLAPGGRATDRIVAVAPNAAGLTFELSSDGASWSRVGQVPACASQCLVAFDLSDLVSGGYAIRAVAGGQASSAHTFIHDGATRYSAPGTPSATAGPLGVTLTWSAPASARPAYYLVERKDPGGGWRTLDRVRATSYIDSTAPPGTEIHYRVSATDFEGTVGQASDDAAVTLPDSRLAIQQAFRPPGIPAGLTVLGDNGRAVLHWQRVQQSDGYVVERQLQSGGPFAVVGLTGAPSFADAPAVEAGPYTYRVRAIDDGVIGEPSNEVSTVILPTAAPTPMGDSTSAPTLPATPTGLETVAGAGGVRVSWTAHGGTEATTTYTLYRSNPISGVFTMAAAGLHTTSFLDAALPSGVTFGYVVTASSAVGSESPFSAPSWASVPANTPPLQVGFVGPAATEALYPTGDDLRALAAVTAAAAVVGVQFDLSRAGGPWHTLPAGPIDPRSPGLPAPLMVAGSSAVWAASLNTASLAPGSYQLRVRARDAEGRMQEQIQTLYIADAPSRGPPAIALTTTPIPGGIHLAWVSSAAKFTIQRSIFGPDGPFDSIASINALEFDDRTAIPGRSYFYRVVAQADTSLSSAAVTASAGTGQAAPATSGPTVEAGPVSRSQLTLTVTAATASPALPSGLQAYGIAYAVDATSLASVSPVHLLADTAKITFALPNNSVDAATAAVYHWDDAAASWVTEASSTSADGIAITATVDHFSAFVLAIRTPVPTGGGGSQPPPPTVDQAAGGQRNPPLALTHPPAPLQVAADGEVVSLRSAYSRVYKNADGTLQQTVSLEPLNYRDERGEWQKIDTALVADSSAQGYVVNRAGSFDVELPVDTATGPIRFTTSGVTTTFRLEGAQSTQRAQAGNGATYRGILGDIDAQYKVTPSALKETFVLTAKPTTPLILAFDINTGSFTLQRLADGTVVAVDAMGRTQYTINAPWMQEVPQRPNDQIAATSSAVAVTLTGSTGVYRLTYIPDAAWLNDPSRIYPVTIDPSFSVGDQYDVQINSYASTFNYNGYTYDPVGFTNYTSPCCGNGASRAMIQFASSSLLYDGVYATSAALYVYVYTDYDCSRSWEPNGTTFHASAAQGAWTYTGVKWSNQPGYTDTYGTGAATTLRCNFNYWLGMDATGLVRTWETHAFPNYGFVIHADGEFGCNGSCNNSENFYSAASGTAPYMTINYTTYGYVTSLYQYVGAGQLSPPTIAPNGGITSVELILQNVGLATWATDTRLSYRWWENGVAVTGYADNPSQYVPYAVPGSSAIILRFNLVAPARTDAGPVYLQFAVANSVFSFSSLYWGASPSYACDQFYYNSSTPSCTTGTPITLADESATITGPGVPALITASAGALVSIPITVQNTVPAAKWASWSSTNVQSTVLVGSRDYRTQQGGVGPLANLLTFLPQDVAAGGSQNINLLLQMPSDPGDYSLRIDLVHQAGTTFTWFAEKGNIPFEVPVRALAAGDDKTTLVSAPLNDGTSLGTNTTNGQAVLAATDLSVPELGATTLHLTRTYNGASSGALNNGTGATSLTYGAGWTFDFMRTLRLGALGPDTYSSKQGLYTDAQGRSWIATWNAGRGLWEVPAANITISASTATVVSSNAGSMTVPAMAPVDTVSRGATMLVADAGAPRAWAIDLDNPQPDALIIPASQVPSQQNGTIELKVKLDFTSTDAGTHTLFADTTGRFKLTWSGNGLTFTTADVNGSTVSVSVANLGWTSNGTWHHVGVLWNEGGAIQLVADNLTSALSTTRVGQSPTGDVYFGYDPSGAAANPWNGLMAEIRIEGHVVAVNTIKADTGVLAADANTLFLGAFDPAHGLNSAAGTYTLKNPDQSIEEYNALGQLIDEQDRTGNKITYAWDSSGRVMTISDATIAGRTISFAYGSNQFTATDFSGRSVSYGLNANGDLVSVVRSNQVPNPLTGTYASVPTTTTYAYLPGHVLSQVVDPRGGRTTLTYDQSYRSTVLADGPAGYWRLGDIGTVAADAAGTNTGAIVNETAANLGLPGAIFRDPNTSIKFDGSTQYVRAGASPLGTGAFSLEGWINHAGVAWSAGLETVISLQGNATYIGISGGAVTVSATIGGVQRTVTGGSVPADGWHQLAGTWDGTYLRLYIDGTLSGIPGGPYTGATTLNGNVLIATYDGTTSMFSGRLDEVAAYPAALAASDVQAHFLAGRLGGPAAPGAYAANIALDDPVGWWRLGDSSGTLAADQSGYGRQGTYSGGVTLGQPGAISGDPTTATNFDGASGIVTAPATGSLPRWTLEAWIDPTGNQSQDASVISDVYSTLVNYTLVFNPSGSTPLSLQTGFYDGAGWHTTPVVSVLKGAWSHVVGTYDGTTIALYINGVRVSSLAYTASPGSNGLGLRIGRRWDLANYFLGGIEDAAIYPFAMSAARILAHYQSGVGRAPMSTELGPPSYAPTVLADNPSGYWRLGETSGPTALDQVTGTYDGVYTGGYTLGVTGAVAGDTDTALGLNGTTAYMGVPAYNLTTFSAEVWWDGTPGGNGWSGPMQLRQSGMNGFQFVNNAASTTTFTPHLTIWNGSSEVAQFAAGVSYPMPFGDMKAFVWTYDGSSARLFVNGAEVPVSTSAVAGYATSCTCVGLGYSEVGGRVDEAAVYNYVLTPARILAHYQAARPAAAVSRGSQPVSYTGAVAADNPIGYYRLDEAGGTTAYDRSGQGKNGTYSASGTVLYQQPGALATDADSAVQFDGSAGTVSLTNLPIDTASGHQVTVELWMFYLALANEMPFGFAAYDLYLVPNVGFGFNTGAGDLYGVPMSSVPQNRWLHVVAVFTNGSVTSNQLYINGVQQALRQLQGSPVSRSVGATAQISGWSTDAGYKFNGLVDDVSIYNGALSPARVLVHFRAGRTVPSNAASYSYAVTADQPIGYWRLSDASGPTAAAVVATGGATATYSGTEFFGEPSEFPADTNTSVRFDGATGAVALASLPIVTTSAKQTTVELWLYWLGGTSAQMPFGFSQYGLLLDPAYGFGFTTSAAGTDLYGVALSAVPASTWLLVDAVFTNSGMTSNKLYINGVAQTLSQLHGTATSRTVTTTANISGWPLNASFKFNGIVADVSIYNGALSAGRILAHYGNGLGLDFKKVNAMIDARGNPVATFFYNADLTQTRVQDARGLNSYYTFQSYGGRTLSITDTGGNVTKFVYDGTDAFRLIATVSPSGIQDARIASSSAPVGQREQTLLTDRSGHPGPATQVYMDGSAPAGSTLLTTNETWAWDASLEVNPGRPSHTSSPTGGFHQHYLQGAPGIVIPSGSTVIQWVYIEPGVDAPDELILQFLADGSSWSHRAHWGFGLYDFGCGFANCGAVDLGIGALPPSGAWVQLSASLDAVGMNSHAMTGIAFTLLGGSGTVWWGPTLLQFPGGSINDPTSAFSTSDYDQFNDPTVSVDPNGIANISDVNNLGQVRQVAGGVEPLPGHALNNTPVASGFDCTASGTSCAGLTESHTSRGLQSDIWQDFGPFPAGTRLAVSTNATTSATGVGAGGAVLVVEDSPTYTANVAGQRTAPLQTAGASKGVTVPFVVDQSRYVRVLLWQENFFGSTTWTAPVLTDIDPAPDTTLEASTTVYSTDFEQQLDRNAWSTGMLQDATNAHGGQWSAHESLPTSNGDAHFYRSFSVLASNDYKLSAWVRTLQSGSQGTPGPMPGASFVITTAETGGTNIATSPVVQTEGRWQLLSFIFNSGANTSINVRLDLANFAGDAFFDDLSLVNLSDTAGVTNWIATSTLTGVVVHNLATGGLAGGGSRQVSMPASTAVNQVQDALQTAPLRNGATYVISVWASSTLATGTIDFSLRDGSQGVIPLGASSSCAITNALTLCQNYATWNGTDKTNGYLVLQYGGSTTARTITIAHPLVALSSQRFDFTTPGQPSRVYDVFGRSVTSTYDTNGLYLTQVAITATPSPNRTVNFTNNSIGMAILSTRVNGSATIAEQTWRDSWGRVVGVVQNCVTAVAPPKKCSATTTSSVNVLTRYSFDLNGNVTDSFTQGTVSGTWVDSHSDYDGDGNPIDVIANYIPGQPETATQNVTTRSTYDAAGELIDVISPAATAGGSTVTHAIYDAARRPEVAISNYLVGATPDSDTNVATTTNYDADGRVTTVWTPAGVGQIPTVTAYDVLGRAVRRVVGTNTPPSGFTPATAQTDLTLDPGGRVTDVLGPGTGSPAVRYTTHYDLDALGRQLSVTQAFNCPGGCPSATSRFVYDPRGAVVVYSPQTQQLFGGVASRTVYDLAGQMTSVIDDWQPGAGSAPDLNVTTSTTYDGYGRPISKTDPRGIVTQTTYDGLDRPSTQTLDPSVLKLTWTYTYSLAGDRIQVVNPRNGTNRTDQTVYDVLHRPVAAYRNCVNCLTNATHDYQTNVESDATFDSVGNVLTTTDPLRRVNVYTYDSLGRKTSQTLNCVGTGGLCNGVVTSDQNVTTQWQYDSHGDLVSEISPRQCSSSSPCYQGNNGTVVTDGGNLATGYAYDALFRLTRVVEDQGHLQTPTSYTYDPSGNRLSQTDGLGHTTSYGIDSLGRIISVTDAGSNTIRTNFDPAGEILSMVNARGETNSNTFDRVGRAVGMSYLKADGATPLSRTFSYDADGNLTSFSDTDVPATTVTYDNANRVNTATAPSPYGTTTYTYFLDGAVSSITDGNGKATFTEDLLGRTASMVTPLITGTTSYVHDAAGRLTRRTQANAVVTNMTYTGVDQLMSKTETAGSTTLASWTNLSYDPAQNRTSETLSYYAGNPYPDPQAGTTNYQYDTENQLSQAVLPSVGGTYGYDAAHNLTSNAGVSQAYNPNESLQSVGGATTGSDADGNQLHDVNGNALSWNSLNQLEQFGTTESYTYDALGRLTTVAGATGTTKFVYQGLSGDAIQELSSANVVLRSYAWDDSRQLYVKSGGATYYEITNPHGDVVALASGTALVGTSHFESWGKPLYSAGTTTPFGFQGSAGSWTDSTTGFVEMGARWYYPSVGLFLSSDPAVGSASPYAPTSGLRWGYGGNQPVNHTDPSGYDFCMNQIQMGPGLVVGVGSLSLGGLSGSGGSCGGTGPVVVPTNGCYGCQTTTPSTGSIYWDPYATGQIQINSNSQASGSLSSFASVAAQLVAWLKSIGATESSTTTSTGSDTRSPIHSLGPMSSIRAPATTRPALDYAIRQITAPKQEHEREKAPNPVDAIGEQQPIQVNAVPMNNCSSSPINRKVCKKLVDLAMKLLMACLSNDVCAMMLMIAISVVAVLFDPALEEAAAAEFGAGAADARAAVGVGEVVAGGEGAADAAGAVSRGIPEALEEGRAFEATTLDRLGLTKNTIVWRPTAAQAKSAAFQVIVGDAKYTPGGLLKGTILDSNGLEIKGGSSLLRSTYQLRLQTYRALVEGDPLKILTTRPVESDFAAYLDRWGVTLDDLDS